MIQEQISTSSPRCLNGNAGFGVVAQTSGMAPHLARDAGALSGYSHLFSAGDAKNPVAFLHAIRRTGGVDRHILSRVADCGNDYTGRSNRIGHHWIVEEDDIRSLPGGPAAITSQHNLFCTAWKEKSLELPRGKQLPNPQVNAGICRTWQQRLGDAGWGGVVAERIEKGDPISIIFEPGMDVLPLLAEVFTLLPPSVRWRTTFSTYYMKSQEPPNSPKIQIKCIVAGSDEMAFARLIPDTLLIDLRRLPKDQPSGKYVEFARTGVYTKPAISTRTQHIQAAQELELFLVQEEMDDVAETEIYDIAASQTAVPLTARSIPISKRAVPIAESETEPLPKKSSKRLFIGLGIGFLSFISLLVLANFIMVTINHKNRDEIARITRVYAKHAECVVNETKKIAGKAKQQVANLNQKDASDAISFANKAIDNADKARNDADREKEIAENAKDNTLKEVTDAKSRADDAVENAYKALALANEAKESAKKANDVNNALGIANTAIAKVSDVGNEVQKVDDYLDTINKNIASDDVMRIIQEARGCLENIEEELFENAKKDAKDAVKSVNFVGADAGVVNNLNKNLRINEENVKGLIDKKRIALGDAQGRHQEAKALVKKIEDAKKNLENSLPDIWENIWQSIPEPGVLEGSGFLFGIKEYVSISIDKYDILSLESDSDDSNADPIDKAIHSKYLSDERGKVHKIIFYHGKWADEKTERIITFSLYDKGLTYEWHPMINNYNRMRADNAYLDKLRRILMSKLRIEIDGVHGIKGDSKEIALWQPVDYMIDSKKGEGVLSASHSQMDEMVKPSDEAELLLVFEKCELKSRQYPGSYSIDQQEFEKIVIKNEDEKECISASPKALEIGEKQSTVRFGIVRNESGDMTIRLVKVIADNDNQMNNIAIKDFTITPFTINLVKPGEDMNNRDNWLELLHVDVPSDPPKSATNDNQQE